MNIIPAKPKPEVARRWTDTAGGTILPHIEGAATPAQVVHLQKQDAKTPARATAPKRHKRPEVVPEGCYVRDDGALMVPVAPHQYVAANDDEAAKAVAA